jgi:hypothetical protein
LATTTTTTSWTTTMTTPSDQHNKFMKMRTVVSPPPPCPSSAAALPADSLWFAGTMNRRQCEDAVRRGLSGCFLVHKGASRHKSAGVPFVVCVNVRGVLSRLPVRASHSGMFAVGKTEYPTVAALVASIQGSEIRCPPSKSHGSRTVVIGSPAPGGFPFPACVGAFGGGARDVAFTARFGAGQDHRRYKPSFKSVQVSDEFELVEEEEGAAVEGHGRAGQHSRPGPVWTMRTETAGTTGPTHNDYESMSPCVDLSLATDRDAAGTVNPASFAPELKAVAAHAAQTVAIDAAVREAESKLMQLQLLRQHALAAVPLPARLTKESTARDVKKGDARTAAPLYAVPHKGASSSANKRSEDEVTRAAEDATVHATQIAEAERRLVHLQLLRQQASGMPRVLLLQH